MEVLVSRMTVHFRRTQEIGMDSMIGTEKESLNVQSKDLFTLPRLLTACHLLITNNSCTGARLVAKI